MGVNQAFVDQVRGFGVRSRRALAVSAAVGLLVGAAVALFDWVTRDQLLDRLAAAPLAVQIAVPAIGLVLAALALRWLAGGASPSSSDEYIRNFHDPDRQLDLQPVLGRVVAGVATLGLGGALGFEGPSLYLGAAIGSGIQRRWRRSFARDDAKLLMVAGAAAGVAAIFKSPATGAVFALEVPYQDDNASRLLLPALLAAAVSYLTFVTFAGTTPLFAVSGSPPFDLRDLGGALLLGAVCGLGARAFAHLVRAAKHLSTKGHPVVRITVAGSAMAALVGLSYGVYGQGYAFGPGYATIAWVAQPNHALGLVLLLFLIRAVAVAATIAGGGVGGLFIPLVVAGALAGRAIGILVGDPSGTLFPVLGVAAFLGGGYRTPLAAVIFVAETTGQPGFVVPGLLASVMAQLMMGGVSVSSYQRGSRVGHLDEAPVGVAELPGSTSGGDLDPPVDVAGDRLAVPYPPVDVAGDRRAVPDPRGRPEAVVPAVDVVLPVLDEAEAIPVVLGRMPAGYRAIVVDNGSSDGSGALARALGAVVVTAPRQGFGSACWAGLEAATAPIVCFMDCDGSLDPAELPVVVAPLLDGSAELVLGARVAEPGAMAVHARLANRYLARAVRHRHGFALTDLGPMRATHREALLGLGMADRRSGWPLEMVLRAGRAGWRVIEVPVSYRERTGSSKVTGTVGGTLRAVRDMRRQLRLFP